MTVTIESLTVHPGNHADWLADRQSGIGSSEAATALGINPYDTPLALYLRKIGQGEPVETTSAMAWGSRLEPVIAAAYAEEVGMGYQCEQLFVRHPEYPWMLATIDRVREDGRIVELKTVGPRSVREWGESGSDEIPRWYACQVLHQLAVTNTDRADVAALLCGQELRIYHVERDDRVLAALIEREAEFWRGVESRTPPAIDPERDGRLMARLFPDHRPAIDLDDDATALVEHWEELSRQGREYEKERDRLKVEILARVGNAAAARLANGRILTRKVVSVAATTIERRAYDRVDLRLKENDGG